MTPDPVERFLQTHKADDLAALFPDERKPPDPDTFEIALVLAGAVSAGAYTAGVLDFLIQALDEWHKAKLDPAADVPRHTVKVRMVCGASAGGMNGAILAAAAKYRFPHVCVGMDEGECAKNPFFNAWVKRIDISHLLRTGDVEGGRKPEALLNCDILDSIVGEVVGYTGEPADPRHREWLEDPFRLSLTVSNLKGVPYNVAFRGGRGSQHDMAMHADYMSFEVPVFGEAGERPDSVAVPQDRKSAQWKLLGESALATGAFPLALKPRALYRDTAEYHFRDLVVQGTVPLYARTLDERRYEFLNVDGGMMDNEPFEIGRRHLAGQRGSNPRDGNKAQRAVILVDPFPEKLALGPSAFTSLLEIAGSILGAFKTQARFKADDLALVQEGIVYSRFVVSPDRGRAGEGKKLQVASGGLGAFFGFFSEKIRRHDYQLGRANCQSFLRNWFTLQEGNPVMAGDWNRHIHGRDTYAQEQNYRKTHEYQIIPLVGSARDRVVLEPWPVDGLPSWDSLRKPVETRVDALYKAAVNRFGFFAKLYLKLGWKFSVRGMLLDKVRDAIEGAVKDLRDSR